MTTFALRNLPVATALSAALFLGACQQGSEKQTVGTLAGAALGGWAGSQIGGGTGQLAATAAGVLLGGLLGGEIGRSMDELDRLKAQQATQASLERGKVGETTTWTNPDSGHSGTVTPTRTYQATDGRYCREFQQTVQIGGKTEQAYGTACRQPDGTWQIVDS